MALKVAVSPFFGGDSWTDELTGVKFERSKTGTLAVYDLSNVQANKLDGIRKAIRLNALILMEGELGEQVFAEPVKEVKEVKEVVVETPVEEVVEVVESEVKVETKAPAKKK